MNYLLAENITKYYGEKILFENISLGINKGQKIGLIAQNGTGKSTLLKVLIGIEGCDSGKIELHKGVKVGYLDQSPDFNAQDTVLQAVFFAENPILEAISQYEMALEQHQTHNTADTQKKLEQQIERMQFLNAWDYEVKIKQILGKLQIKNFDQTVRQLSGGEKKRLALAALLVQEPDFLVLDEPTNHLDVEMIEWLEDYLSKASLTLLMVTHDRYFLDNVTNHIIELEQGTLYPYKGNYTYFLEKKAERDFNSSQEMSKTKKLMYKELEWVNTSPRARTTKAKSRIDAFEKLREKAQQKWKDEDVSFEGIKMNRIFGNTIELKYISKQYSDTKIIVKDFAYNFQRQDRIGIVGKNGAGKTTLLNLIIGTEKPDKGHVAIGQTVEIGYYTQEGLILEKDMRLIDVVREIAEILPMEKGKHLTAAQLLDHFQFPYSTHTKYVSTLSGGEKRRLYLLTVLMKNPNFLILDEPTNDLDILTLNVLEDFLIKFKGVLLIVSHDRYFMDKLIDHVFVLQGNGEVRDYPGSYSDYRQALQKEKEAESIRQQQLAKEGTTALKTYENKEKRKISYNEKREMELIEKELPTLETQKQAIEQKLANGSANNQDIMNWANELSQILTAIEQKTNRWLELSEWL